MIVFLDGWDEGARRSQIPALKKKSETGGSELDVQFSDVQAVGLGRDHWLTLSRSKNFIGAQILHPHNVWLVWFTRREQGSSRRPNQVFSTEGYD